MIVKKFGVDFHSKGGALTLPQSSVTESQREYGGTHTRTHPSGWTITGELHEDYFVWVNEFLATHPTFGTIKGDFEHEVTADSEEAFADFWKHHEPKAWDYMDI